MVTKRSDILKQTCSFQMQVCLNMCDLFVTMRHYREQKEQKQSRFFVSEESYLYITVKNTVISPNFLVWKLGEVAVFFAVYAFM